MMRWELIMIAATVLGCNVVAATVPDPDGPGAPGPYLHLGSGSPLFENNRLPGTDGQSNLPPEYHPAATMDSAIGWNFNRNEAAELELGYVGAGTNNVMGLFPDRHAGQVPLLANFTLSLPLSRSALVPYLGVGAGGDEMISDSADFSAGTPSLLRNANDVLFAWQAFAGLRFRMSERTSLGLGYKYFAAGDPAAPPPQNLSGALDGVRSHSLLLNFQWKF